MKIAALLLFLSASAYPAPSQKDLANQALDSWHKAASLHEEEKYFSLMSATAVFLGTDPSERWTKEEFRKWAHPIFSQGRGWSISGAKRNLFFSADGKTAWFDEVAESKELGECRGSGVLVKEKGTWKIAQYNLSYPVLNDRFDDVRKINIPKAAEKK